MSEFLKSVIDIFFELWILAIVARVILSWIRPQKRNKLIELIEEVTDPLMNFLKKYIPRFGMLDLSPIFAIIGLEMARAILLSIIS